MIVVVAESTCGGHIWRMWKQGGRLHIECNKIFESYKECKKDGEAFLKRNLKVLEQLEWGIIR